MTALVEQQQWTESYASSVPEVPSILTAAYSGNEDAVKLWLNGDSRDNKLKLRNILLTCAQNGHGPLCQLIISTGLVQPDDVAEALRLACLNGEHNTAKAIIRYVDVVNNKTYAEEALTAASVRGHKTIVEWLMKEAKLSETDSVKWQLAIAGGAGDLKSLDQIMQAKNLSEEPEIMSQALRLACYNGHRRAADWLIIHSAADISARGIVSYERGEMTSLIAASYRGTADVLKVLIDCVTCYTVSINCGKLDDTAMHVAIWCRADETTPLHDACARGDDSQVQDLLYTYDVSRQDGNGHTPLHKACQYGHVSIVKTLLSVFAPPAVTNNWGNTAGQLAESFGNGELAPIMIPANRSPLDCGVNDPRDGSRSEPTAAQAGTATGTSGATAAATAPAAAEAKVVSNVVISNVTSVEKPTSKGGAAAGGGKSGASGSKGGAGGKTPAGKNTRRAV